MTSPEDSNLRRNLLRVSNWLRKWLKCDLPHHCQKRACSSAVWHWLEGVARPCTAGTGIGSQWQCHRLRWIHRRKRHRLVVTQQSGEARPKRVAKNRIIYTIWNYSYHFLYKCSTIWCIFDGVVCLERTFISQDTKFFPGSGQVFSSAQLVVRTQSFSQWILSGRFECCNAF